MRVMVLWKASQDDEAGVMPGGEQRAAMGQYHEALVKAGVLLAGEGLQPSSKGVRVYLSGDKRKVVDGPFTEAKELVGGFALWQVKSMEEAIEWAKRYPSAGGQEFEIEIRPVYEAEDFGGRSAPELQSPEGRLGA